ncbi:MAG: gluconokinase [Planctomycetota bacterium]|jgi:gluconokinase
MVVIVMGVCGSGKNAVGEPLAEMLGGEFFDADDFHPPANVEKMRAGTPLTDEDRWPWLDRLAGEITGWLERPEGAVLACSALTEAYRQRLGVDRPNVRLVYLKGSEELLAERMAGREGHYMPPSLLTSQLKTLEEPRDAIVADISPEPEVIAAEVFRKLRQ